MLSETTALDFLTTGVTPACSSVDPELFFPNDQSERLTALDICAACPLAAPCRDWARTNLPAGIWGGETDQQRHARRITKREAASGPAPDPAPEHGAMRQGPA